MTNKSLSQRLCETCGIEPKYWCSYHSCICPIQDIGKFNSKCPKQSVTKECDARSSKLQYIDFETNTRNFIKLFEIKVTGDITLAQLFFSWNIANYSRELFLKNLVYILKSDSNMDKTVIEFIKEAIRQANWEIR